MDKLDLITEQEYDMIDHYRYSYVEGGCDFAPIRDVLSKVWCEEKENLFKLLGNKLILKKEVEYTKPHSAIVRTLSEKLEEDSKFHSIHQKYWDWLNDSYNNGDKVVREWYYEFKGIIRTQVLAENNVSSYVPHYGIKFETEDNKTVSFSPSMKPMKMLAKLNSIYHFWTDEELEYFRITVSQALNQKKLKGELCLSIHPLDFITMSENKSNWSSCMSWSKYGCYRRGTVEMMNSPYVLVAYITSKNEMDINGNSWNNKKWRELVMVNHDLISSIKGYPYQSPDLAIIVNNWITELAKENWGVEFNTEKDYDYDSSEYEFDFTTGAMYNDFGSTTHHIYLNKEIKNSYFDYNYSGPTQCMRCGRITDDFGEYLELLYECDDQPEAEELACNSCTDYHYDYCPYCEGRIHHEEGYEVDGEIYHEECYADSHTLDFFDEVPTENWGMERYSVLDDSYKGLSDLEIWEKCNNYSDSITIYSRISISCLLHDEEAIKVAPRSVSKHLNWGVTKTYNYFFRSDLNEYYASKIDEYDPRDIWR